jgi:ribosomal protein L40E
MPMSRLRCLFCEHVNPAAAKFCNECGSPLHLRPCLACNAVDARSAANCYKCGAPLPPPTPVVEEAEAETVEPAPPRSVFAVTEATPVRERATSPDTNEPTIMRAAGGVPRTPTPEWTTAFAPADDVHVPQPPASPAESPARASFATLRAAADRSEEAKRPQRASLWALVAVVAAIAVVAATLQSNRTEGPRVGNDAAAATEAPAASVVPTPLPRPAAPASAAGEPGPASDPAPAGCPAAVAALNLCGRTGR